MTSIFEFCVDLIAELALDGVNADRLDRLVQNDLPLVQLDPGLLCKRLGNLRVRDRAEQAARSAALRGDNDGHILHAVAQLERFRALLGLPFLRGLVVHAHGVDVVCGRFLRKLCAAAGSCARSRQIPRSSGRACPDLLHPVLK